MTPTLVLTHYQAHNPPNAALDDPEIFGASSLNPATTTVNKQTTIVVEGTGFNEDCWAVIYQGESPDAFNIIPVEYISPFQVSLSWTPLSAGKYKLIIATGHDTDSLPLSISAIAPVGSSTTVEEMRSLSLVLLSDLSKLKIGNNPDKKSELDLLYYKNIAPKQNSKGAYINSKGYFIFPSLASQRRDRATISFVFYCGSDSNYLVFGYCSEERYNFKSNDYSKTELSLRFRNQSGCYYQHGLFESGRSSFSFMGYIDYDRDYYYRLDIPVGGEYARLYRVEEDPSSWNGGKFKQKIFLTTAPDLVGETLYPFFGNYNKERSPLCGVFIR